MKTSSIDEVTTKLASRPKSLKEATSASGLPREPGLYAWWTAPGSIPDVPRCPHPTVPDLDLFYVGISPSNESSQNLRKRVAGNHIKGNTGGSTFRLTLASLLFETMAWQPVMTDRPPPHRVSAACCPWRWPGDSVGVEIFGELVAAEVADDVQYDPGNERVRS